MGGITQCLSYDVTSKSILVHHLMSLQKKEESQILKYDVIVVIYGTFSCGDMMVAKEGWCALAYVVVLSYRSLRRLYVEFAKASRLLQELLEHTRCDSAAVALRDALNWALHQLCAYYNATKKTDCVSTSQGIEFGDFVWSRRDNEDLPDVIVAVTSGEVARLRYVLKKGDAASCYCNAILL